MRLRPTLLFACYMLVYSLSTAQDEIINIGLIYSGGGQYNSSGVVPAVQLAVELINNRTDLLNGYQLNISYTGDSECDKAVSQRAFFEEEVRNRPWPHTLALVGCGCSLATEPIAEVTQYWNMIHMAYASSSDSFSDRTRFPNFWRTYPQESDLASSVLSIMKHYNWRKLKIITQDLPIFTSGTDVLNRAVSDSENITVDQNGTIIFDPDSNVANATDLFYPETRVYFLNMYPEHARRVLCAAATAKEGEADPRFAYDKYVWITLGWYRDGWWRVERLRDNLVTNCTDKDVEQFLPQSLGIIQANTADNTTAETDVELSADEFLTEYKDLLETTRYDFEISAYHAYDAMWALAFAFDSALKSGASLANYSYFAGNSTIENIRSYLNNTNFTGVSGPVVLNINGTRMSENPRILKYRDENVTNNCGVTGPSTIERQRVAFVGVSNGSNETVYEYYSCEDDNTTWPDGIPADGTPCEVTVTILTPLVIVYYILAGCGIIFALICLMFNFIFRNRKIVKLISPNLNYLVILGAILLYMCMFFYVFPSTDEFAVTFACQIRLWLQPVGFFICFGTIVLKIWRVYYIFRNPAVNKKKRSRIPKDWQLFLGVCALVLVCVIITACVSIFGNYGAVRVRDEELPPSRGDDGIVIEYYNLVCEGPLDIAWIIVVYAYIVLTQLFAFFLAVRTRKVTIKALNDSKYLAALIYVSTAILIIMVVCAVLLDKYLNTDAAVFSGLLFIYTTLVLSLMFIPKMVILYKDPQGQKIFQRSMSQSLQNTVLGTTNEDDSDKYLELEKHCRDLEGRLAKCGEAVPAFRARRSSTKLKSSSFSAIPPSSPNRVNDISISAPTSPIKSVQIKDTGITNGTSGYFTEPDRMSNSSTERKSPSQLEANSNV